MDVFSKPPAGRSRSLWRPAALVIGILTPGVRLGWQEILRIFLNAGRGVLEIAAITGLAG